MTAANRLLATALSQVGYIEKETNAQLDHPAKNAGDNNWTKYARDLDAMGVVYNGKKNGYDWCDIFVDWCYITTFGLAAGMALLCQTERGLGAGCTYSARYYKDKGQFHRGGPKPGDQIFFSRDGSACYHTGIVEKVENGRVYTIEGNTSSAAGVVANGGIVARKSYPLDYAHICGYGRPDFSMIEEDEDMDLEGFKKLWREMRRELQDNDSSEYSEEARKWAVETGLVAGGSTEEFNGMWEDMLTREQLVTVLYRFAQKMGMA